MLSAARLPQVRAEACISLQANWERSKVWTVRTMSGELKVQLRNESQFVEVSEVCSGEQTFAQIRTGFRLGSRRTSVWLHLYFIICKRREKVGYKPVLNWANVCSPNILRTVRRTMIRFLIELLVRRTWFGQFDELYFVLSWLVMRCKLGPELAADSQQTAWSKM